MRSATDQTASVSVRLALAVLVVVAAAAAVTPAAPAEAATRLVDVSRQANIFDISRTWSAEVGDFDSDGWDDLLVVNHYEKPAFLYRNRRNGRFGRHDTGPDTFKVRDRHDCVFGDVSDDGLVDIYCSIGGGRGREQHPNELFIQQPDGSFVNRARQYGVRDLLGRGRDVAMLDADGDGLLDIYVGNKFPRNDRFKSKNKLFLNVDGTRFVQAPDSWRMTREVGGESVEAVDYNLDARPDLLVCGERRTFLFRNVASQSFQEVARQAGIAVPCAEALTTRVNHDPLPDVVVVTDRRLKVMVQRRNGTFRRIYTRRLDGGVSVAAGRVNRDALGDVYVMQHGVDGGVERDLMLLNRDGGRSFRSISIPQTNRGVGDDVVAIDFDRDGRSDFVTLDGHRHTRGPVRLLAARG